MTDHRAAQDKLDADVGEYLATAAAPGMLTTGYILISHQTQFDDQGHEVSSYQIAYAGGSMPDHSALGLLTMASDIIRGTGRYGREDDD